MANYVLVSPDRHHEIVLRYVGEPPHGDSFHEIDVDGAKLPGFAWGCNFAFTPKSRFFAASWMSERYQRQTIILDVEQRRYFVLPTYIADFTFRWPILNGVGSAEGLRFEFDGSETWAPF
jgi:hypothetical protein